MSGAPAPDSAMTSRIPSLLLAACVLVPPAVAQQTPFFDVDGKTDVAWPATTYPEPPTRVAVGHFTGDGNADALILTGTIGVLEYSPAQHSALVQLPGLVKDVAAFPLAGVPRSDAVLVLDENGVLLLDAYDGGAFDQTYLVVEPAWAGATRVGVYDLDGNGELDLYGLGASGTTILIALDAREPVPALSSFDVASPVLDLAALAWGAQPALAVLTTTGMRVHAWDGAEVAAYLGTGFESGFVEPLRQAGAPPSKIAVCYRVAGSDHLTVIDASGPDTYLPLGPIGAYAGAAGDVTGDGYDDLVLLHATNHLAALFPNEARVGATFETVQTIDLGPGAQPAAGQTAQPALLDFTNDGDVDLLVHVDATESLRLFENTATDHATLEPSISSGSYFFGEEEQRGVLYLTALVPPLPFQVTHAELTVWTQPDPDGKLDPAALAHGFYPAGAGGKTSVRLAVEEEGLETSRLYYLELRGVRRLGAATTHVGPTAVWAFATPVSDVTALQTIHGDQGVPVRVHLLDEALTLGKKAERERSVSPTTVKGDKLPPSELPPDPFG